VDDGSTVVTTIDYQNTNHIAVTQASGTQQALQTTYDYAYCNGKQLVTKRTDAMQACTTYAYDGLGRLTSVVDPGGVSSVTAYDTVGRPASFASYNKSIVLWQKNYSYDDVNGKETFQDAKGNMIVIQKDTLGRPVSKTATAVDVPGTGTTTFVFDSEQSSNSQGRISSASMPDGSAYTYQYDAYGNQTSISLSVDGHNWTVQQSYGPTKELQTRTHPDGSVETHVCTSGGEVSEIDLAENAQAPASRLISFDDFTSLGKPQTITYANGVSATLSFGTIGQLKAQTVTGPGATSVYSGVFEKNALGLLSTATDPLSQSQEVFDYDGVGRLAGVTGGTTGRSYQYDLAGNITLKDGIQYVSAGNEVGTGTQNGSTVLQAAFDRNGNIAQATRNGATNTYLYDAENRLASAGTTSFSYDYSGRRLKKQVSGGPTAVNCAFEIGAAGRMTLNVVAGALGGGAGNVAGQVLANEFSDDFTGQSVTAGLGYAALSGVVLGGVGTAIGEGTTRALSNVPDWDSATEAQLDKYSDRLWTRTDDFRVTGRDLPFQRELDATPKNKVLVFLPGYVANWAAFGLTLTQTFKPSWFPGW